MNGRGDRIRTYDPLVPNQVRYQTAPLPDRSKIKAVLFVSQPYCKRKITLFEFFFILAKFLTIWVEKTGHFWDLSAYTES